MNSNTEVSTKENTAIIMAAESGYAYDGFVMSGYNVFCSYKHVGLLFRCIREVCFKIPFLSQTPWFDKRIVDFKPQYIIVRDAIITKKYLLWLQRMFPETQINFLYENMVGNAKNIQPCEIPEGIRIWTYDRYDSERYNLRLKQSLTYFSEYVVDKGQVLYDVLFVGRDKGRGDWLHEFDLFLQKKGYRTKFVITKDSRFSKRKKYYHKEVPYVTIAEWMAHTRCIINVAMENQSGVTTRDLECLFNKIKMITTNEHIKEVYFYNPTNIFILNADNWNNVPDFLETEYDNSVLIDENMHSVHTMVKELTSTH